MQKDKELESLKELLKEYLVAEGYTEIRDPFEIDIYIDESGVMQSGPFTIRSTALNSDGKRVGFIMWPYEREIYCEKELVAKVLQEGEFFTYKKMEKA